MSYLVEILTLKVIFQIMQQRQTLKIFHMLILHTSCFPLKTNIAALKTELDKLDINKLVPVPVDLSKLNDVVKNDVVKKTDYNAEITDIEGKIPDVSNLATKTVLTTVENKIPSVSELATNPHYLQLKIKYLMFLI